MSISEERDELNQSLGQWREKVRSLEKTNCDTRNLISILEDDIRAGRKEYEALQSNMEKLKTQRQQVQSWTIQEKGVIENLSPGYKLILYKKLSAATKLDSPVWFISRHIKSVLHFFFTAILEAISLKFSFLSKAVGAG